MRRFTAVMQVAKVFVVLSALALIAKANPIAFIASSNGSTMSMHITGTDTLGDSIDATFLSSDLATVPFCGCSSGAPIQAIEGWNGVGTAIVNGITYSTFIPLLGGNEGGLTSINGALPAITAPDGSKVTVTFPITWNMDVFFYTGPANSPVVLFELKGRGLA